MIGENYRNAGVPREGATPQERERLAMLHEQQAQNDDVQQAIHALRKVQPTLLYAFAASLTTFVFAATAMAWIKTVYHHKQVIEREGDDCPNTIAIILTTAFGLLGVAITFVRMRPLGLASSRARRVTSTRAAEARPAARALLLDGRPSAG